MTTPAPFAHSYGVVIGIDHYGGGIPALRTAVNDARRLGDLLATDHGYDVTALLDADATQASITALLKTTLPAKVGADDRVLFYFAGHGVARDGDDGPAGYLLPVDAQRGDEMTYLDMPLVHDALLALECRHMLIVLDSCFSGAFRWSGTRSFEDDVSVVHQEKYDRYVRDAAWQVITSAAQDQRAIDQLSSGALGSRDGDGAHSPFALALFAGLAGAGDIVPHGGDGLVTANELFVYLDQTLETAAIAAGKSQTPGFWSLRKQDKGQFVFFVPGKDLSLPPAPPLTFENNPWRGLTSYDAADATLFFGRDDEITALRAMVETRALTVVLGASGTGKSSLVKAGVVPQLAAAGWLVLPIVRPGSAPMLALAQACAVAGQPPTESPAAAFTAGIASLLAASAGQKVLLVIDQFEELITLVRRAEERDAVLALLATLCAEHADTLRLVVTIRTDFEPNFDRAAFGERWREGRYVVRPMAREDLRAVIEKPAALRVLYFDPSNLVETLLDEVAATPGALPLLSFALSEMYIGYVRRESSDRAITRADYDALGGVVGALRARAESEYAALDDASKGTLRRVMLRMVTADGGSLARQRVTDAELEFADDGERARAATVVQRLTAARLLVEGKDPDGDAFVEPAHDALVRGWGRLLQWVREESEAAFPLVQQRRMARAALEWERAADSQKSDLLWRDASRSAQLAPLVRGHASWFTVRELQFARRSVRGRRIARAIAIALTAVIVAVSIVSAVQWRRAEQSLAVADEARAIADFQRADAMRQKALADFEKARMLSSLFASLSVSMAAGNPGSICTRPSCPDAPMADSGTFMTLSRLPQSLRSLYGDEVSRNFIVARDFGLGHVLVYAQDGLTTDGEMKAGGDNLVFAENALRWLGATATVADSAVRSGCSAGPPRVLLWEGTYVPLRVMTRVSASVSQRGWIMEAVHHDTFAAQLRCAAVLWFVNDWNPPADFVTEDVPMIARFVRDGGGLLVGGLGWSYRENPDRHPTVPYPADELGKVFGFSFTSDAFEAPVGQRIGLLGTVPLPPVDVKVAMTRLGDPKEGYPPSPESKDLKSKRE